MTEISAGLVKELRELTGLGMMECKKALTEAGGDLRKAEELLRIRSGAKASKAASRIAAEGVIGAFVSADAKLGALVELNSETDFVAKNEQFQQLAADIVAHAASAKPADRETLLAERLADGRTVQENIDATAAVIGEKLELGRVVVFDGQVAAYMHRRSPDLPPQVGVLVQFEGDDVAAARGAAMQVAAMRPRYVSREDVPAETVESERRIAEATAREEGKPEQALPKIVEGRLAGFFKEVALLDQPSVQDGKQTVRAVLDAAGVTVKRFARFEVGQS
jgi:elongation factor Ts